MSSKIIAHRVIRYDRIHVCVQVSKDARKHVRGENPTSYVGQDRLEGNWVELGGYFPQGIRRYFLSLLASPHRSDGTAPKTHRIAASRDCERPYYGPFDARFQKLPIESLNISGTSRSSLEVC